MKITFLGTGTSGGVPVINCSCSVCKSENEKNRRLRCSVMIETQGRILLVDASTDMRQQLLINPFPRIDALLLTHAHADHIFGLDEIRRFNYLQKERIPVFGSEDTLNRVLEVFDYTVQEGELREGVPNISAHPVSKEFAIGSVRIMPVPLLHGALEILGYRIGNFAYCTDVSGIPEASYHLLRGLDVLVLDALREKAHPSHFTLRQAIAEAEKIGARQTWFTHISHNLDHEAHSRMLPKGCQFAFDGLVLEL
jgi:phosphoribosyl 1,2-cyclic phosphate phosphodiesterase